jgi:hypothetical protein
MKILVFVCICSIFCLQFSCIRIPTQTLEYTHFEKIQVAPGPEDLQLYFDAQTNRYQLFVSCDERREQKTFGSIWSIDLENNKPTQLNILFKNQQKEFHPHGMHVFENYLFVIDHANNYKTSRIIRFKINGDTLVEDTIFEKGIIGSPNDLVAINKDVFLYSNFEFNGSVVRYENGKYIELIKRLRNPNGIDSISIDGHPFGLLSCTYLKKVYRFDTQTGEKKKIAKVKGGDNFTYNEGKVLLAGHLRFYKFIGHIKKNTPSPSVVYELDVMNRTKKAVFVDDGTKISTVSTALYFNNRIYLGQIFDDFVLVGFVGR